MSNPGQGSPPRNIKKFLTVSDQQKDPLPPKVIQQQSKYITSTGALKKDYTPSASNVITPHRRDFSSKGAKYLNNAAQ